MQTPLLGIALSRIANEPLYRMLVEDMRTYVNRSSEIRQHEAKLRRKIKRASNAFILYRKCYRNVATKIIQEHIKNGVHISIQVSIICGFSWKNLEPEEVKRAFKSWSVTDRLMLRKTFPEYQYHPIRRGKTQEMHSEGVNQDKSILYHSHLISDSSIVIYSTEKGIQAHVTHNFLCLTWSYLEIDPQHVY